MGEFFFFFKEPFWVFFRLFVYLFIYFWLCWVFVCVRGLSLVAASGGHSSSRCAGLSLSRPLLLAEHRLQMRRLRSCGSRAQLLRGMWDLPRPGLEPVSPALAGRFSTTVPPGKPNGWVFEGEHASDIWYLYIPYVVMWIFCLTLRSTSKFSSWIDLSPKIQHTSLKLTLTVFFKLMQVHFNISPREAIQKSESFQNQNLYSGYIHTFALLHWNR